MGSDPKSKPNSGRQINQEASDSESDLVESDSRLGTHSEADSEETTDVSDLESDYLLTTSGIGINSKSISQRIERSSNSSLKKTTSQCSKSKLEKSTRSDKRRMTKRQKLKANSDKVQAKYVNFFDRDDDNDKNDQLVDGTRNIGRQSTTAVNDSDKNRWQQDSHMRRPRQPQQQQQHEINGKATAPMLRARVHLGKRRQHERKQQDDGDEHYLPIEIQHQDQHENKNQFEAVKPPNRTDRIDKQQGQLSLLNDNNNKYSTPTSLFSNEDTGEYYEHQLSITERNQCSKLGPPLLLARIVNLFKDLYYTRPDLSDRNYRKGRPPSRNCDTSDNKCQLIRNKDTKLSASKTTEWQSELLSEEDSSATGNSKTIIGGGNRTINSSSLDDNNNFQDMPNRSGTYGTNVGGPRYQTPDNESGRVRRSSNSRRFRDPVNNYSRLGQHHYNKSSGESASIFQEFKRFLLLLVIIAVCGVILWQIYEVLIDDDINFLGVVKHSPSELGKFYNHAVSTDAKPCASVGEQLLAKGGHAVDAAIGTLICMGVVLPNSLGLGGGCLMTIYDNVTKQAIIIDGREQAPDYAHQDMFNTSLAASRGPLSVGVPGELAAYWEAHKRFGRLKWSELFDESIRMADQGSPIVEHLAHAMRDPSHAIYISEPLRQILWNNSTGEYTAEGEILRQPALAQTLKRIRDNGAEELYRGQTGFAFIEDLQKQGGKMTMDNLSKYKPLVKNATTINLNENLKVYTQPVPGSGIVLSVILRIMRNLGYYQSEKPKQSFAGASLYYHHLAEAFKFAYAQRGALEDQPEDPERMQQLIEKLESETFIQDVVSKIKSSQKTLPIEEYGGLTHFKADHGTAHCSVVDADGNSIAVTTSVNLYFGSGLVSPSTGIVYNDVMDDFVSPNITNKFGLAPSRFNRIRPGRRPISSMAPSIFVDGEGNPKLVIGASGGSKITTAIASVAIRNIFMNEDIKTAIDGPRIHHQFLPTQVWFESNFPSELVTELELRGHKVAKITGRSSIVMAIACDYYQNGTQKLLTANSDYRKGGSVAGV